MALASYPGLLQVVSAVGTCVLGPHPGVALVRVLPQVGVPATNGHLVFSEGVNTFTWYNARLDQASLEITTNGHVVSCRIFDRRFWWKFTSITGVYNERRSDGDLYEDFEKTPRELAMLLLDAMGESGYDVSALPNSATDRPFVNWRCSNPAYALYELCKDRGCDIALNHITNTVKIVQLGVGASIPPTDVQSVDYGVDLGEYPQFLKVCFGPTIYQAKLKLEAVGLDTDGQIKPIDDLSYAPAGGWEAESPEDLIPDADLEEWVLANDTVFRLYRIVKFADDSLDLPGEADEIDTIEQILPIRRELVESDVDPVTGRVEFRPAYVEGVFLRTGNIEVIGADANTEAGTRYPFGFEIIENRGLVRFDDPVVKQNSTGHEAADLYLYTSFNVRENDNHQYWGYEVTRTLTGGIGTYPIQQPEAALIIKAQYDSSDPTAYDDPETTDNQDDLDSLGEAILDATLPQFSTFTSLEVYYRGIQAIATDGVNRQVTHAVSRKGSNTRVAQNCEPELGIMRERERTQLAQFRQSQQVSSQKKLSLSEFQNKRGFK